MKLLVLSLLTLFLYSACTTKYYIVRHAERENNTADSPLSDTGFVRADILRDTLLGKGIDLIFASTFRRTQQTAQPLATALQQSLILYKPDTTAGLVSRLQKIRGKQVLVVGHSNTVPDLVQGLCGQAVSVGDHEFDKLFIVRISRGWGPVRKSLVETRYGP